MFRYFNADFLKILAVFGILLLILAFFLYRIGSVPPDREDHTSIPLITEENSVHFSKVPENVGDDLWVFGELDHVFISNNDNYFLNFCPDFRSCPFSGVIFSEYARFFDDIESWSGQEIYIYGTVGTYEGRPQIIIEKKEQVVLGENALFRANDDGKDSSEESPVEVVNVIDGDTLLVSFEGEIDLVRLIGIDAPEVKGPYSEEECYGPEAAAFLEGVLDEGSVILKRSDEVPDEDQYGRLLRFVHTKEGEEVNSLMVKEGYAFVYVLESFSKVKDLKEMEDEARIDRRGLWSEECEYYFRY